MSDSSVNVEGKLDVLTRFKLDVCEFSSQCIKLYVCEFSSQCIKLDVCELPYSGYVSYGKSLVFFVLMKAGTKV